MRRHAKAVAALLLVLSALGACIDVRIGLVADIRAFIAIAGSRHRYRVTVPADGDPLTIVITTKKGSTANFTVTVTGPGGELDVSGSAVAAPGSFTLTAFPLPAAGEHTIDVAADKQVEYRMKVQVGTDKQPVTKLDLRPKKFG